MNIKYQSLSHLLNFLRPVPVY